jgi:hypothetical protein
MSNTETKVCKKCGVEKGVGEFVRGKRPVNRKECNKCVNKRKIEQDRLKYNNDPEWKQKYKERKKNWKLNNVEAQKAIVKRSNTKQRLSGKANIFDKISTDELIDRYVKQALIKHAKGLTFSDIPPHLVEQKRQQLIAKREARANKNK